MTLQGQVTHHADAGRKRGEIAATLHGELGTILEWA
jgi:hypothetical protein